MAKNGRTGRPKVEWSEKQWEAFDLFCRLTDKKNRVAVAMGHDVKTIDRLVRERHGTTFSRYLLQRFEDGNFTLLARQFEAAVGREPEVVDGVLIPGRPPSATMLIWLGKNRLGQTDKLAVDAKTQTRAIAKINITPIDPKADATPDGGKKR